MKKTKQTIEIRILDQNGDTNKHETIAEAVKTLMAEHLEKRKWVNIGASHFMFKSRSDTDIAEVEEDAQALTAALTDALNKSGEVIVTVTGALAGGMYVDDPTDDENFLDDHISLGTEEFIDDLVSPAEPEWKKTLKREMVQALEAAIKAAEAKAQAEAKAKESTYPKVKIRESALRDPVKMRAVSNWLRTKVLTDGPVTIIVAAGK